MFSGKNIFNFGVLKSLRAFQNPISTGGVVEENGICSAAFCESAALREKSAQVFSGLNPLSFAALSTVRCGLSLLEIRVSLSAPATTHRSAPTDSFICSYLYYITSVVILPLCGIALACNSAFCLSVRNIMFVVFHITIAKRCYKIRVICLIGSQVELIISLPPLFHAICNKMLKKCFLICPKYLCKVRVQFQIILVIVNCLVLCQLLYKRRVLQPYSPMSAIIGISYSFSTSIHISNYRIIHINVVDNIACPHYVIKSASAVTCCILNLIFGQICTTVNVVCIWHNKEIPIRITINPRQNVIFSN